MDRNTDSPRPKPIAKIGFASVCRPLASLHSERRLNSLEGAVCKRSQAEAASRTAVTAVEACAVAVVVRMLEVIASSFARASFEAAS